MDRSSAPKPASGRSTSKAVYETMAVHRQGPVGAHRSGVRHQAGFTPQVMNMRGETKPPPRPPIHSILAASNSTILMAPTSISAASSSAPAALSLSAETGKRPIKYEPFGGPHEFSDWMPELFDQYLHYRGGQFRFAWLQKASDLKVVCRDATAVEVCFPISQALEDAIQKCTRIDDPVQWVSITRIEPRDDGWGSWLTSTCDMVSDGLDICRGDWTYVAKGLANI